MEVDMNRGATKSLVKGSFNERREDQVELDDDSGPKYLNYRVVGYLFGGAVHMGNIIAMACMLRGPIMEEGPEVKLFYSMEYFYCTIWNLVFQLLYIGMGLACDLPVLLKRNHNILDQLRTYRKVFYSGLLFPVGMTIFLVYWPVYAYDRNLVFPEYIDRVLSQVSNYIMHMFIVFPILWDLVFLPNPKPASYRYSLGHTIVLGAAYYITMFALYGIRGVWPYPVLTQIFGTIYFPTVLVCVAIILFLVYFIQWPIKSCIWRRCCSEKFR